MDPRPPLTRIGTLVAIGLVVAWLSMIAWLASSIDAGDREWARMVGLLASVEAVALAAAGALLGTSIQRQRVVDAQVRAEKAEGEAKSNAEAAAAGRTLAKAIHAQSGAGMDDDGPQRLSSEPGSADELADLRRLARALFPDSS